MKAAHLVGLVARSAATAAVLRNVLRAASRQRPVTSTTVAVPTISVVVPARDEAARIGPLLSAVVGAPGVAEVVVVDDESSDDTAIVAATGGARVVTGRPPPAGWAGKVWALQQGLDAASGEWVVMLDADTRPSPLLPAALVARALAERLDVLTVGGRFDCPTVGLRLLHPALLTTLVYRLPPPGARDPGPVHRRLANGQCVAASRELLAAAGGFGAVAHRSVEDLALVRALATAGFAVGALDAADLLTVRMYEHAGEAWHGWGRSLAMPGVETPVRRVADLVTLALTQAAPLVRVLLRRGDALDVVLLAVRAGTLAGTAPAYRRRGPAYWLSPLADVAAVAALARCTLWRPPAWRGRAAIQKRRPTKDISAPVDAVRRAPSTRICSTG